MTRLLTPPIAWRDLGQSALRVVFLATAAGAMAAGKFLYVNGARLQDLGERFR